MVSHKRIKEILQNWGLENEKLTEIISEETGTGREMLQKEYERLKIMVEDGRGIEQFKEKDWRMNVLLELFFTFAKIGLFTFGGGYAMISVIENNCVERKKWISHDEMMNMTVIAESTPGPIAVNCATFTGYKIAGVVGALVATVGMVIPSFVIIYLISMFLDNFLEVAIVAYAFQGIKIAVGLLIFDAGITMLKKMKKKKLSGIIVTCSCGIMLCVNIFCWNFSSTSLMLIAAVVSLSIFIINGAPEQKGGAKE